MHDHLHDADGNARAGPEGKVGRGAVREKSVGVAYGGGGCTVRCVERTRDER